jgi:surface antigen
MNRHVHSQVRRLPARRWPVALLSFCLALPAAATPPPWAPAHGWRAKQGAAYRAPAPAPVAAWSPAPVPDIRGGRCNRETLGALLGGVAGGVLGSKVGEGSGRTLATIGGVLLGALAGGSIGRSMDSADQACMQRTLEHAPDRRAVGWTNPDTGRAWSVEPLRTWSDSGGRPCREYVTEVREDGRIREITERACRTPDGNWQRLG